MEHSIRAHACEACGQPFADRQVYHTLLFDEPPELRRSTSARRAGRSRMPAIRAAGPGLSRIGREFTRAPPPVSDPIHKDTAETLLRKLIEQTTRVTRPPVTSSPSCLNASACSSEGANRQRRQARVHLRAARDRRRVHHCRSRPAPGPARAVQRDVAALLEHGLNPPAPEPAAPSQLNPHRKISRLHEVKTSNIQHPVCRVA